MANEFDNTYIYRRTDLESVRELTERKFPRIEDEESEVYKAFMNGHIFSCSFNVAEINIDLLENILIKSLTNASIGSTRYSAHGGKHKSYQPAIDALINSVKNHEFEMGNVPQAQGEWGTKFVLTSTLDPKPRVIFTDLLTIADEYYDTSIFGKIRVQNLDEFSPICTSDVVTAYFKSKHRKQL